MRMGSVVKRPVLNHVKAILHFNRATMEKIIKLVEDAYMSTPDLRDACETVQKRCAIYASTRRKEG